MNVPRVIGSNIKELMEKKKISARKLSEVIGVAHPTMSSYIKGDKAIDSDKLMVIARYFNERLEYFFEVKHNDLPIMFRADKPVENISESQYDDIRHKIANYNDIVEDNIRYIPQTYSLVIEDKLNNDAERAIEQIAYKQRRLFDIENHIPENYFSTLSDAGINVLCYKLDNSMLFGASSYAKSKGSYIFVNTNEVISLERQIFSLIHELGHLIFHRNEYQDPDYNPYYKTTRGDIREKVADTFAGYFLIPRDMVMEYMSRYSEDSQISLIDMKRYFKVSIQSLVMALYNYGEITQEKYREFWKLIVKNG